MIDSGVRYCVVHHGLIEQDEMDGCDFAEDEVECVFRPLMYDPPATGDYAQGNGTDIDALCDN